MAKEQIRLQYSGYVIFAAKMVSVMTGLAFQFMIARSTTTQQYDIWFNISDILAYLTLMAGVLPFWVMRFVARGKEGTVKTGIIANLAISAIAIVIYLPLVPYITSALGIHQEFIFLYFLVSVQIIELYFMNVLEACLRAKIPQTLGYGIIAAELCKVILGYVIIIRYHQPLLGAIVSLIVAFAIQIAYYFRLLAGELRQRVNLGYLKEWLKGSVLNIYNIAGAQVAAFVFILLFSYGGEGARSNYGAAAQIASVISYASFLAFALYPKLIAEKNTEDITTSLKMVLTFAIPMMAGVLAMPVSYLTILDVKYAKAAPVLILLALDAFVATLSSIFSFVLYGAERIDEKKMSFKELAKSKLFIAFSLPYIHSAITLPTALFVLTNYTQNQPLQSAICVSIINSVTRFAMFLVLYAIVRKMITINIPWKNIAKYISASAIMAAILFAVATTLNPSRLYLTLGITAMGGIIYLALLVAIDDEARSLANSLWHQIRTVIQNISG